ncbi:DNA polymerase III subunit delta [bacterium]|nr:DNA polymerase III subunit delta [bacterium]
MAIQGAKELAGRLAAIRKGSAGGIFLVHGTEAYLVRTAADALVAALAETSGAERCTIDATGKGAAEVLEPVTSLSLFASTQVALVRNFAHLLTGDASDALLKGLDRGLDGANAVVFAAAGVTPGDKIDKRVKGYKGLVKRGSVVELNTQKPEDLVMWLTEKAREEGKKLDRDAAHLLIQRTGTDMESLRMELEKALLFHLDADRITAAGLAELVGKSREDAVWDVTERIHAGDVVGALRMVEDLFATGTFPLVVLTLLVRQTRHLLQARLLWDAAGRPPFRDMRAFQARVLPRVAKGAFGSGPDDVTTIHPFASFKRFEAAQAQGVPALRAQLTRLRRADREAKTGVTAGASAVVEELILDLCATGRSAA